MVDTECTPELAFTEQVVERDTRSHRNAGPELFPSIASVVEGVD